MVEMRSHLATERAGVVTLHLKAGAPEFYPNRASDTRLHRQVAIKVSAARFSERFAREARVIASLNHPNICQLYYVGANFLVMELVEGPTLTERIRKGALPWTSRWPLPVR